MKYFPLLILATLALSAHARTIPVSSTSELLAARDSLRKEKPTEPVDVVLKPGEYYFARPFDLTAADSGTPAAPIRYLTPDGQDRAIWTAAKHVPSARFKPYRDGIVVADISDLGLAIPSRSQIQGVTTMPLPVPEVFVDGERFATADWPNAGEWSTFTNIVEKGYDWTIKSDPKADLTKLSKGVFGYEGDRPARWTKAPYVWVHGYFKFDWRDNVLWMEKVDPETKTIALGHAATYGLGKGNPSPRRWRAVHLLEELDVPGEYYVDFFGKKLYLMPKKPLTDKTRIDIVAGANRLIHSYNVKHVTLKNIILRNANEALRGKDCSAVTFDNVRVENMRGNGVFLEESDHVLVTRCDFAAMGSNCLTLSGGNRKTLESAHNRVVDCTFGPAGLLNRTGAAGFTTWGVGTVFEHNFVHDTPHTAIGVGWQGGNDCVFAYNVVSNCCNESDDASAFYKGRNPSACGNILDHNVFVECGMNGKHGTMAVYFDDGDCGDVVRDCLFIRSGNKSYPGRPFTHGALFFNGGYAFTVERNVFIDCTTGSRTSALEANGKGWATDAWWKEQLQKLNQRLTEEVCVTGAVYQAHYPWMKDLLPGLPDGQRTNYFNQCTFINVPTPTNGRSFCLPNCRILDHDDGTRPAGIEKAGVLTPR